MKPASVPPAPPRLSRRSFLAASSAVCALSAAGALPASLKPMHLATNTYPWGTFAKREGLTFVPHSDETLAAIAAAGVRGYEPIILDPAGLDGLPARLRAHGLEMRSLYVNSTLHEPARAQESIDAVLAIARPAAAMGVKIIVTNPSPIRWGGPENKTDAQLLAQAAALDRLGAELAALGLALAYHNHDIELREGAREFHHMLTATNPAHVRFCLDAHWVFRGCGDSQVALFDALELHGDRIVELHLRQSSGGVWTEAFAAGGDIDYARLAAWLAARGLRPHLVLEQAVEERSPHTMTVVEAHRLGVRHATEVFAGFA